jgi:hypothetical protein
VLGDRWRKGRNLWLDGTEFLQQIAVKNEEGQQTPSSRYFFRFCWTFYGNPVATTAAISAIWFAVI